MDNGPTPFRVVWLTAYRYGNAAVIVVFGALRVKHRRIFATPWVYATEPRSFSCVCLGLFGGGIAEKETEVLYCLRKESPLTVGRSGVTNPSGLFDYSENFEQQLKKPDNQIEQRNKDRHFGE